MTNDRDIYASAMLLIKQHGSNAEEVAMEKMLFFMEKDNAKGASVWLSIMNAIDTLREKGRQRYLQ